MAEDTPQKRTQFTPVVTKTAVLTESASSGDMDEVVRALHEIAGINKVTLNPGTREITMRDTAEKIAVGESLLKRYRGRRPANWCSKSSCSKSTATRQPNSAFRCHKA